MLQKQLHIHGDNIVECERTLRLIAASLDIDCKNLQPTGTAACPAFDLTLPGQCPVQLNVTCFPGFGRWNQNILSHFRASGGTLREAADAIMTVVVDGHEVPLVAIEYCGALPAGNQAWQRNGRAYSFGRAKIPFLYVAELGGFELTPTRTRKSARMPNPAVPFSYLSYSIEQETAVLPIFVASPGADNDSQIVYLSAFANAEFRELTKALILEDSTEPTIDKIRNRVLEFVRIRAGLMRRGETLSPEQWANAYERLKAGISSISTYVQTDARLPWAKMAYIDGLTRSAKKLMEISKRYAIGLTSKKLPICIVPKNQRKQFALEISKLYAPRIRQDFIDWLGRNADLAICWIMGFKPRGDDARPDRGLAPFARMLVGKSTDMLSVVYGPAPGDTWTMLKADPIGLAKRNGLWEAILETSDALLVDAVTDSVTPHGFLKSHWYQLLVKTEIAPILVEPQPIRFSEQDVDTAIHVLLHHFGGTQVFEGMCNPPGGDWSGVSLLSSDQKTELRWLSLPRVSASQAKRPDHVFQFFGINKLPIILSVESKDVASAVETGIGPRLTRYISELTATSASIERHSANAPWKHSDKAIAPSRFQSASAIAFIPITSTDMATVAAKSNCDIVIGCNFDNETGLCHVELLANTKVGRTVGKYIERIKTPLHKTVLAKPI
jgi:hypothetical protein